MVATDYCGHGVPLDEECDGCQFENEIADMVPEHDCGRVYNCGSASCTLPEPSLRDY